MQPFWLALGWSKDREVRVQDGFAFFEVAEQGHCSTCASRISSVRSAIERSGLPSTDFKSAYLHDRYPADAKTLWMGVRVDDDFTQEQIVKKLSSALGLSVHCAYER